MSQEPRKKLSEGFVLASEVKKTGHKMAPEPPKKSAPRISTDTRVNTLREALSLFRARLVSMRLQNIILNGARIGTLFRQEMTGSTYLVLFKREFYVRFSRHFEVPDADKGWGLLCNKKLVQFCAEHGYRIAVVMPDAKCYWLEGKAFWAFYEEFETDCPYAPGEIAAPLKRFRRLF